MYHASRKEVSQNGYVMTSTCVNLNMRQCLSAKVFFITVMFMYKIDTVTSKTSLCHYFCLQDLALQMSVIGNSLKYFVNFTFFTTEHLSMRLVENPTDVALVWDNVNVSTGINYWVRTSSPVFVLYSNFMEQQTWRREVAAGVRSFHH